MNKLPRLFYDLSVYKDIVQETLGHSLLRFSLAYVLLGLAYGFWINNKYMPGIINDTQAVGQAALNQISDTTSFSLHNGVFSAANLTQPITLSLPSDPTPPLVYINPAADLTALASSSALMAFGQTHYRLLTDTNATVASYAEEKLTDFTVSGTTIRQSIANWLQFVNRYRSVFPLFLAVPTFIFFWLERFPLTLFYALILFLFGSLFSRQYRFKQYWLLALNTIIVAEVINLIVLVIYQQSVPVVFTLAFMGTTILAYLNLPVYPATKNPVE